MFLKTTVFIGFYLCMTQFVFCQTVFYQDLIKGGVTGAGVNFGSTFGTLALSIFIEPGSTIKKAFLISSSDGTPENIDVVVNGTEYAFTNNTVITTNFLSIYSAPPSSSINIIDVTNSINETETNYSISIPNQNYISQEAYYQFYLFVVYENLGLQETAVSIIINNTDVEAIINYNLTNLLSIDSNEEIGLSILGKHLCDTIQDGSFVDVNSYNIGLVGGSDANSPAYCTGISGGFYYQNNTLFGLSDDTPDVVMSGTDALANIQSYVNNGDSQLSLDFIYQNSGSANGAKSNPIIAVFLAYTSSCDTFSVSTHSDTTLCLNSTLQLSASTSNPSATYEWQPATGLSCTTCPNPIFTADSSMFYTVRIWNNDSCSVVRPVKINVRPKPSFGDVITEPSECGASSASAPATGSATLFALPNNSSVESWSEVGGNTQTSNFFQNLSAGFHTFNFIDTNGCQSADTTIFIGEINSTVASFTANPQSGAVPLEVNFTNTSVNATSYEWFTSTGSMTTPLGATLQNWEFGISGNYEVMLVAWQFDPSCADTFALNIIVYDSLIVQIPNVFTPNGDGVNDFFGITSSLVVDAEVVILNRWGNEVFSKDLTLQQGFNAVWDSSNVTDGTYFYKVVLSQNVDVPVVKGLEAPVEYTGFVVVSR